MNRCVFALSIVFELTLSLTSVPANSQASPAPKLPLPVGEFISEGGWGTLNLKRTEAKLLFAIESLGSNGHSCSVDGEIKDGVAKVSAMDEGKPCVIEFARTPNGIDVKPVGDVMLCRYFCGMRASFDGTYFDVTPGCRTNEVKQARRLFSEAYAKKDYSKAQSFLQPVYEKCEAFVGLWQSFDIRNDMAITLYHLKEKAACLKALEPMVAIAQDTEKNIRESYPPSDADGMMQVRKAASTNLALCRRLP